MMTDADSRDHLMAAVAYVLGPVTGIFFLLTETNSFIRFHAMQSTVLFGGLMVVIGVVWLIPVFGPMVLMMVSPLLYTGSFLLWLVLMWKGYQGETYRVPYISDIVDQQLRKFS